MSKTILHIDINSYFATMLQQENPHLRGKPVGVLKSAGRSCVIAASKEAKKRGVKTGSSLKDARRLCPDLITLPAAFSRYLDATKRLQQIFASVAPDYYIYSLDEVFVDITDCRQRLYPDPVQTGRNIQQQIKNELGEWVTCNVGISYNRLLAKLASEVSPKGSVTVIDESNVDAYLASTGFADVCGIGFGLSRKLHRIGVTTPYQLRFYTVQDLEPLVGPFWARELLRIAYGEDSHNLTLTERTLPHMKSVGRSITGFRPYDKEEEIRAVLYNLMEEVTYKARRMKLAGRYVGIGLYSAGNRPHVQQLGWGGVRSTWSAHRTLKHHICHTQEMFDILYHQLYQAWQRPFPIIKFAVVLGMLKPLDHTDQPIFPQWHKQHAIYKAMDKISDKYGLFTLRSGSLLNQHIIRPEVTGYLGDREYQLEHT